MIIRSSIIFNVVHTLCPHSSLLEVITILVARASITFVSMDIGPQTTWLKIIGSQCNLLHSIAFYGILWLCTHGYMIDTRTA